MKSELLFQTSALFCTKIEPSIKRRQQNEPLPRQSSAHPHVPRTHQATCIQSRVEHTQKRLAETAKN